jgi:hypothetical protein
VRVGMNADPAGTNDWEQSKLRVKNLLLLSKRSYGMLILESNRSILQWAKNPTFGRGLSR